LDANKDASEKGRMKIAQAINQTEEKEEFVG
jgi:hypothetical protein